MASDITLAVGDDSRRMSYAELAQAPPNISIPAVRRLPLRHQWRKQIPLCARAVQRFSEPDQKFDAYNNTVDRGADLDQPRCAAFK